MSVRNRLAALGAAAFVFLGLVFLPAGTTSERDPRWNFVIIVTDDQSFDSIPHDPPVMPYLQAATGDPEDHWIVFRNGFVNTPLCCPSRATLLTGAYAHHHGVLNNDLATRMDEDATIVKWLHDAGYYTGLVGKYLNQYPFDRGPFVPEGWDRWWGKRQGPVTTLYHDYTLIEDGTPVHYGSDEDDYSTDVFADKAVAFLQDAPLEQPFLLWFAPTAPHPPWDSAARHEGLFAQMRLAPPESIGEPDIADKPAWVQALPALGPAERAGLREGHRASFETLLAVDDAVRRIVEALEQRGDLDHTVIVYLSDNGYSFGEHRWVKKTCAYEECVRVPFLVRFPFSARRVERTPISGVDLAPTLADLAGLDLPAPVDGSSFAELIAHDDASGLPEAVFLEWVGDARVPGWWQIRTEDFAYIELATGERELYDLRVDPLQLENVVDDEAYAGDVLTLSAELASFRAS